MEFVITIGILIIFAALLTIIFKRRISETISIAVVEMILIVYACGLFDNLRLGVNLLFIFAIVQLFTIVIVLCKKKNNDEVKEIIKRIIVPELFVYFGLCLISIIINKDRIFMDYDEYTHWGRIVKTMFVSNNFGTNMDSIVYFNEYPPATPTFQYIFVAIKNVFSEDVIITAQNILYFSIIMPLFNNLFRKDNIKKSLMFLFGMLVIPMIFIKNFYLDILVDGIMGVYFVMAIYYCFENDKEIFFKYLKLFSCLIMLCLMKTTGIALAVLVILALLPKIIRNKKELKYLSIMVIVISIITIIWYIKAENGAKRWDFNQYVQTENKTTEEMIEVAKIYIKEFFIRKTITDQKFTMCTISLILVIFYIYVAKGYENKEYKYYLKVINIIFLLYVFFLMITYMTIFDMSEAPRLTSYWRYNATMLIPMSIYGLIGLFKSDRKIKIKECIFIFVILFNLLPHENIYQKYIDYKNYIEYSKNSRESFSQIKNYRGLFEKDDRILYVNGYEGVVKYSIAQYELLPQKIVDETDALFKEKEEFEKILEDGNYDYVYIYRMQDEVREVVKEIFKDELIKNDCLYKVVKENDENKLELF